MPDSETAADSRVCAWCSQPIPAAAVRCPFCQMWRKDVHNERVLCWIWILASLFPVGILIFLRVALGAGIPWLLVAVLIAWLALHGLMTIIYWVRVSRKIGTWFWF